MVQTCNNRVAFFLASLRGGGAERVMLNIAISLVAHGYSVDLILVKREGEYLKKVPDTIRLIDLGSRGALNSIPRLVHYFRREQPSFIFPSLPHISLVTLAARYLSRARSRVVIVEHNTLSQSVQFAQTYKGRILPIFMRLLYPLADRIVAVSTGVADDLSISLNMPRHRIEVIYNPVVTSETLALSREPLSSPWFTDGAPPVILGIGRLTHAKGFSALIRAFSKVRETLPCRLIILGEGADRPTLECIISELGVSSDAMLPGFVENPYAFLKGSALFVLSSLWEGLPTVLIEALACDTPVVSTDCPSGPREILEDGRWGKLVPVNDDDALASAISESLTSPRLSIPKISWARFTLEETISKYLAILRSTD